MSCIHEILDSGQACPSDQPCSGCRVHATATGRATRPRQQHPRSPSRKTMVRPYITKQFKYSHISHLSTIFHAVVTAITYQRLCSKGLIDIQCKWAAHSCAQASEPADGTKMVWNAVSNAVHDPYTQQKVTLLNNNTILCRSTQWPTVPYRRPRSYVPQGCTWRNGKPQGAAHHPTLTTVWHR